jgi:hypothetical protein
LSETRIPTHFRRRGCGCCRLRNGCRSHGHSHLCRHRHGGMSASSSKPQQAPSKEPRSPSFPRRPAVACCHLTRLGAGVLENANASAQQPGPRLRGSASHSGSTLDDARSVLDRPRLATNEMDASSHVHCLAEPHVREGEADSVRRLELDESRRMPAICTTSKERVSVLPSVSPHLLVVGRDEESSRRN